eukprot:jgi/Tetstr1/420868/TSEL_011941.t1
MLPTTPPQEPALAHSAQPAPHTMSFSDAHLHDVFLTHDWQGADGRNHERVARVNCCLQELGLRTWFDEQRMTGKVQERMAEGLEDSGGVLVFVTQRYHDKVTGKDQSDNCKFEFDIALAYNQANMLPVVMELDMLNPQKWRRTMRALGTKMFVNLSNIDNLTDDQLLGFVETRLLPQMTWLPESLHQKAESAAAIIPRSSSSRSRAPSGAVKFEEEPEMDLQVEELVIGLAVGLSGNPQGQLSITATLAGHSDSVNSVAFSPDGATVASGSGDTTVRLWDAASGALTATLEGHSSIVHSVAFSPDGATVASGSYDTTVRLWDAASGALTATLEGHWNAVFSVAFSPDGATVASGSYDTTVRLWDAASGALTATLEGHSDGVRSVAFSPDGATVASGSDDTTVRLWDAASGALTATLEWHSGIVYSVAFGPDGATVASGSWDTTVRLWDAASGALTATLEEHSDRVISVACSPDGATVASGSLDNTVRLWDAASGALTATLVGHSGSVYSVAFSPDGATVASGSWDKTVRLWDVGMSGV